MDLSMSLTRAARRYTIEIKEGEGTVVCAVVRWDDQDKRRALAAALDRAASDGLLMDAHLALPRTN